MPVVARSLDPPLLRLQGIEKHFGDTAALQDVSLEVRTGEIHCLLGANGSGKSTLTKILTGFHRPDGGTAEVFGEPVKWPLAAHLDGRMALAVVHQDRALAQNMTVAENIFVSRPVMRWRRTVISHAGEEQEAARRLREFGVDLDPRRTVGELSPAARAIIEVVRAVHDLRHWYRAPGLLLLDEPTATLPASESAVVLDVIRRVASLDVGVLFVSHRLDEVMEVGTRFTILRNGRVVASGSPSAMSKAALIDRMVAETEAKQAPALCQSLDTRSLGQEGQEGLDGVILGVDGLSGFGVEDVSFEVCTGEIVGLAGVSGAGHDAVLELLFGTERAYGGTVTVGGRAVEITSPRSALEAGMAFLAPDRKHRGVVGSATIRENMTLPFVGRFSRAGWVRRRLERDRVAAQMQALGVANAGTETALGALSGGNQQKVLLGRWLEFDASVYLLSEPTEGVDVGTRSVLYEVLHDLADSGRGVLVSSSDEDELATLCDRVFIFVGGRIVTELTGELVTRENIVRGTEQILPGTTGD